MATPENRPPENLEDGHQNRKSHDRKTEDEIFSDGGALDRIGEKLIEAMTQFTAMRGTLLEIYAALADLRRERKEGKP